MISVNFAKNNGEATASLRYLLNGSVGGLANYSKPYCFLNQSFPNLAKTRINLTYHDIKNTCPNWESGDFDRIEFNLGHSSDNNEYSLYIDDITINYNNGSNSLPTANISIQNFSYCLVNDTLDIPVNISVSDPESDTIYYATTLAKYTNATTLINFYKSLCITPLPCINVQDPSKINQLNTGGCTVNTKVAYNSSSHNLVARKDLFNNDVYMLELNSDCDRTDKSFSRVIGLTGLYSKSALFELDSNEELNFSYMRDDNYEFFKLVVKVNASNLDVYFNDTLRVTLGKTLDTYIGVIPEESSYTITVSNSTRYKNFTVTADALNQRVNHIQYTPYGKVKLHHLQYQGISTSPVFSTTKPTEITVSTIGRQYFTLYVTDNINLGTDFKSYSIPFTVYDSQSCGYVSGAIGTEDFVNNQDVLGAIKSFLGVNLKSYLNTLGSYEKGKNLLWTIFFFLLLGLIATFSFATGSIVLEIPLMISSLGIGFLAFLIDYTGIFISMLIILALSLVASLSGIFGGGRQ